MSFDLLDVQLVEQDLGTEFADPRTPSQAARTLPAPDLDPDSLHDIPPDLVERLARQLARAHGEDPDARPHRLQRPCWCYHRARAKMLLAITPAELEALSTVRAPTDQEIHSALPKPSPWSRIRIFGRTHRAFIRRSQDPHQSDEHL